MTFDVSVFLRVFEFHFAESSKQQKLGRNSVVSRQLAPKTVCCPRQRGYVFTLCVCLFVCLFVYRITQKLLSRFFLPRVAMRKRGLCCRPVSVRPSVTLVYCIQTAEDIVILLVRPGSPITLVF